MGVLRNGSGHASFTQITAPRGFWRRAWQMGIGMRKTLTAPQKIWAWIKGAVIAAVIGLAAPVMAQDGAATGEVPTWIQLEALPSLSLAEDRARAYEAQLSPIAGFALGARWYLITMGPFAPAEAAGRMAALKAEGRIPSDAYLTDGSGHGPQFWPVGAAQVAATSTDAATTDAAPVPETSTAATTPEQPAPPAPPPAAPPADESESEALASEGALSREEKAQLQAGLLWYGHYDGKLDGSIGRGTRASMAAWQTAMGYAPTGVLTTLQRATLLANYRADEAAFGFAPYTDGEAGVEFSLPAALLAFDHYEPPFAHFTAKDGSDLRLLLISEPGDTSTLSGLYDLLQTLDSVPNAGERTLGDGSFVLNGQSPDKAAFATARASKGAIKGYMLLWNPAQNDIAQRILTVMETSFRSTGDQVLDPGLVPLDDTLRSGVLAGMAVKQPSATVSGVFVDANGMVLTVADAVAACGKITLDGAAEAEVLATDGAIGAAILRPLAPLSPLAVAQPATQSSALGTQVLLAGYSLPKGLPAPVLTQGTVQAIGGPSGEAGMLILSANVTTHDRGGPALDAQGRLTGMILGAQLGGKTLPQGTALALDMAALAPLFAQAGVSDGESAPPETSSVDTVNASAMGMTVQVACWP
ncbi:MAG: serine protease [Cypionkella sp.]|nr:serine protease [Cypionkella sp.]